MKSHSDQFLYKQLSLHFLTLVLIFKVFSCFSSKYSLAIQGHSPT